MHIVVQLKHDSASKSVKQPWPTVSAPSLPVFKNKLILYKLTFPFSVHFILAVLFVYPVHFYA